MNVERGGSESQTILSRLVLLALLGAFVAVPALTVIRGFSNGRLVFVLYREPKLAVFMVLGWTLLAAYCWTHRRRLDLTPWLTVSRRHEVVALIALIAYMSVSMSWALVPANGLYEVSQFGLLTALLLCLVIWAQHDPAVVSVVRWALVVSIGVATFIGLLQLTGWLTILPPINPYEEVSHPSLMGYKNTMALAVMGQLFVLAGCIWSRRSKGANASALALGFVLVAEVFYLVTLLSRSSLVGLVMGAVFLAFLQLMTRLKGRKASMAGALAAVVVVSVVAGASTFMAPARDKALSVVDYLGHPSTIVDSDRGIFAVNTINMARSHPFGVGIGDWQSMYPVHRAHGRYFNFNDERQLRRAHSDHVQMLGEVGVPGIALWSFFLVLLIWRTGHHGIKHNRLWSQLLAAQLVAFSFAMCTDYVTEFPYLKLQFFLVVSLSVLSVPIDLRPRTRFVLSPRCGALVAGVVAVFALVCAIHSVGFTRKLIAGGQLQRHYMLATAASEGLETDPSLRRVAEHELAECTRFGEEFGRLHGHTKRVFRGYLLVSDAWRRLHRHDIARSYLERSLELNPYHVPAFRMMSRLARCASEEREWSEAADTVMDRTTNGFHGELPTGHPLRKVTSPKAKPKMRERNWAEDRGERYGAGDSHRVGAARAGLRTPDHPPFLCDQARVAPRAETASNQMSSSLGR